MTNHLGPIRIALAVFFQSTTPAERAHLLECSACRDAFDRAASMDLEVRLDEERGICAVCRRRACMCVSFYDDETLG